MLNKQCVLNFFSAKWYTASCMAVVTGRSYIAVYSSASPLGRSANGADSQGKWLLEPDLVISGGKNIAKIKTTAKTKK